jgi:hypothetical protein
MILNDKLTNLRSEAEEVIKAAQLAFDSKNPKEYLSAHAVFDRLAKSMAHEGMPIREIYAYEVRFSDITQGVASR